jgi:predicted transcriptional regulator
MKVVSFKLPDDLYSGLEELARVYARGGVGNSRAEPFED